MAQSREYGRAQNPGRWNQRITITQKTEGTQDSFGAPATTWATYQACYASVVAMQGRELEAAQQTFKDARLKVTTHYLAGVTTAMRITWGDRTLEILDAEDPTGLRESSVMTCKETT